MFQGVYDGIKNHEPDLPHVLKRAWSQGVKKIIIKGTNLSSSLEALALAKTDSKLPLHTHTYPVLLQSILV